MRRLHHLRTLTLGIVIALVAALSSVFKTRAALQLENLALRHQLGVSASLGEEAKVEPTRPVPLGLAVRSVGWADWRSALIVVKPETMIAWHRKMLSAPRSPWQRAYVERVIGTIQRECLDHVIVFNEASLYRHVKSFVTYDHESRMHLSLGKDSPESRAVQPPELGRVVAIPQVGGLHHRYERRAA